MPIKKVIEKSQKGYYQYGRLKRYYFDPRNSRSIIVAHKKAKKQATAVQLSKPFQRKYLF